MYLFTLFVLAIFALLERCIPRKALFICAFFSFFLLIIHDGFRWEVGTDWNSYYHFFQYCNVVDTDFDVGYVVFNKLVNGYTDNYTIFILIFALIQYSILIPLMLKYSLSPFLSLYLYYCISLPLLGMNRQFLAILFCLISIKYIVKRNFVLFSLCMCGGFLFHKSILLFAPVFFINRKINNKFYLIFIVCAILIAVSGVVNKLPLEYFAILGSDSEERIEFYTSDALANGIYSSPLSVLFGILKRSIWIILLILFAKHVKHKNDLYYVFLNISVISLVVYIIFNNTMLQIVVSRGMIYYNMMEIFLIPYLFTIFKKGAVKTILLIIILYYGYLLMIKGVNYYPEVFYPYRNILF